MKEYLNILGLSKRKPDCDFLTELVRAHITKIPFENISKLYYLKQHGLKYIPALDEYLEGIEKYNFGGTCYSNNYYFHLLLKDLGFDVMLCGAAMSEQDVHLVNIINIDGAYYLADTGYGAPFYTPVPINSDKEYIFVNGNEEYKIFSSAETRKTEVKHLRNGIEIHGYRVNPQVREIEDFKKIIEKSFLPDAEFMNRIMIIKFCEGKSWCLRNFNYFETEGSKTNITKLESMKELHNKAEEAFGIPQNITQTAFEGMNFE